MSSPRASPAPTTPPAPPNATSPPPAVSAPPPVATSPPPVPSPPAPVVTPPPSISPPAPVTPATPPPADSPPSSTPPPSSSPSPPSPPSSTPSPSSRSSPPPPSGRRSPPPPPHTPTPATPSSNGGGGGGGSTGVSTPTVIGLAIAAVAVLAVVSLIFIFCRKKKRRGYPPHDYLGPPSGPKVDPYGGQGYQWQNNAPPPGNHHAVSMPPKINPPPGGASRPPHSPYMSSGGSNYSGSENPQNVQSPPSHGMAYGFAKSTFTYEELARATDGFSEANLLGQGGFGYVHRGILPREGTEVAIKQLKAGSGQGEREFQAEVEIISRVHHKHLVTLVGYCITGQQRLLVYEFVPNNTLEFHLHGKGRPPLDWSTRMKIALGSAKGLAYLHEDCHPKIIHRDIKAANILIDFSFEAKVADFGLAKLTSDVNTHVSTRVMGTFGYLAPEYAASGKLTDKSDVFSFGVVLLEMITGRRPVDSFNGMEDSLVDWARPLLLRAVEEDNYSLLVDPRLQNNFNRNEMARVVGLAAHCVRHAAKPRPRMSQVVRVLEGDVSLSDLNDGFRPGHGSVYSSHGSSDYDTVQYQEDMKRMRKTALADSSEYGATSEYGLNPSGSSSEAPTTSEMIMGKVKKDNNSQ